MPKKIEKSDRIYKLESRIYGLDIETYNGFGSWGHANIALCDVLTAVSDPDYRKIEPNCRGIISTVLLNYSRACQDLPKYQEMQRFIFSTISVFGSIILNRRNPNSPIGKRKKDEAHTVIATLVQDMQRLSDALGEKEVGVEMLQFLLEEPLDPVVRTAYQVLESSDAA